MTPRPPAKVRDGSRVVGAIVPAPGGRVYYTRGQMSLTLPLRSIAAAAAVAKKAPPR